MAQTLEMRHAIPSSDHMEIATTTQQISRYYYWPGMSVDIHRLKSCPQCQKLAPKHWTALAILVEMPITGTPFERVSMDIVGSLTRTKRRNS